VFLLPVRTPPAAWGTTTAFQVLLSVWPVLSAIAEWPCLLAAAAVLFSRLSLYYTLQMDLGTIRSEIKAWERQFKSDHGRHPSVQDIKDADMGQHLLHFISSSIPLPCPMAHPPHSSSSLLLPNPL
jgi:hypothetical protein